MCSNRCTTRPVESQRCSSPPGPPGARHPVARWHRGHPKSRGWVHGHRCRLPELVVAICVSPAEVLTAARAQLEVLLDRLPAGFGDDDLVDGLAATQELKSAVAALEARLLPEADLRDLARKPRPRGRAAAGGRPSCPRAKAAPRGLARRLVPPPRRAPPPRGTTSRGARPPA